MGATNFASLVGPAKYHEVFMAQKLSPEQLRSFRWFGPPTQRGFSHRSRMKQLGFRNEDFTGKPVIDHQYME